MKKQPKTKMVAPCMEGAFELDKELMLLSEMCGFFKKEALIKTHPFQVNIYQNFHQFKQHSDITVGG